MPGVTYCAAACRTGRRPSSKRRRQRRRRSRPRRCAPSLCVRSTRRTPVRIPGPLAPTRALDGFGCLTWGDTDMAAASRYYRGRGPPHARAFKHLSCVQQAKLKKAQAAKKAGAAPKSAVPQCKDMTAASKPKVIARAVAHALGIELNADGTEVSHYPRRPCRRRAGNKGSGGRGQLQDFGSWVTPAETPSRPLWCAARRGHAALQR